MKEYEFEIVGSHPKIIFLRHEWNEDVEDPEVTITFLKNKQCSGDIFSFVQRIPDINPRYSYKMEWDNFAVIPLTTHKHWWEKQITQEARNKARKAMKNGVEIRCVEFNETFVEGIKEIYDESPLRQGKPFKHYKKDFETLFNIHKTFLDQSYFIGAYIDDKLIGFIKLVSTDKFTRTFHVISKNEHRDKAPTNALISKAVEYCCGKNVPYLVYGQYDYGKVGSKSLLKFKMENGFIRMDFPRYYVPLNLYGAAALKTGLHKGIINLLPAYLIDYLKQIRGRYYSSRV